MIGLRELSHTARDVGAVIPTGGIAPTGRVQMASGVPPVSSFSSSSAATGAGPTASVGAP